MRSTLTFSRTELNKAPTALRTSEPSAALMCVHVINTFNRLVELLFVMTTTAHKRGLNCSGRVCMIFKLDMMTPSRRSSTPGRPRMGMTMRASRGQHAPETSLRFGPTASTRWSSARATCGPWLIKSA